MDGASITRFAPSPTGRLHLGHAVSARFARERGVRCLLRVEDIDPVRCRPELIPALEADLAWLGLAFDGPVRRQSEHMAEYTAALDRLEGMGLLYPCFCTRADIAAAGHAPHGPEGAVYPGTCRCLSGAERAARMAAGLLYARRLDMGEAVRRAGRLTRHEAGEGRLACNPAAFGDVVLARKDVPASYHLCATQDDAVQGVTLVTRSDDLRAASDVHRLLQALLGWPEPGYAHHPLLLDESGRRLAKRDGAVAIGALREAGVSAAEVWAMAEGMRRSG